MTYAFDPDTHYHAPDAQIAHAAEDAAEDLELSAAYLAALEAVRVAARTYNEIRDAYRQGLIGDTEYLIARKLYTEHEAAYDAAYAVEMGGQS